MSDVIYKPIALSPDVETEGKKGFLLLGKDENGKTVVLEFSRGLKVASTDLVEVLSQAVSKLTLIEKHLSAISGETFVEGEL